MQVLDFSTSNSQISDEIINVPNSTPVNLQHDVFYNKTGKLVVIRTAAGGGGTLLTETTDYTIGSAFPDADFPTSISPDVGYQTVAITNATYQNTDLYVAYYPIMDIVNATRWNTEIKYNAGGDFDISASNQTYDLTDVRSYPAGYVFRVSWYDGDGSNTFSFTGGGSSTINNIAYTEWVGEGTGHLDLRYLGSDKFEVINSGEVWDCDGGNFASESWEKHLSGVLIQRAFGDTITGAPTALTFSIAYASSSNQVDARSKSFGNRVAFVTAITTTGFNITVYNAATGATDGSGTVDWDATGRWTTSYPRIISV